MIDAKTPISSGVVLLFDSTMGPPPSLNRYWRVPDLITPLESDGRFSVEVGEGTYYIQIASKNPDSEIGPAVEQEHVYFHGDAKGNALPVVVGMNAKVDLGKLKASLWLPKMEIRDKGITSVEGVVLDAAGKPVERAIVLAHYHPGARGRPVFISDRTDKKGKYQLRTNDGGTFYLSVRSVVGGGRPEGGEYLNTTKEFEPVPVTLKKNERLQGVNLKVIKFERRMEQPGSAEKRELKPLEK